MKAYNKTGANTKLFYAKGCNIDDTIRSGFKEAADLAAQSDIIQSLPLGRQGIWVEEKSRSNIHLPGVQEELVKARLLPPATCGCAGECRQSHFNWTADNATACCVYRWLGTAAARKPLLTCCLAITILPVNCPWVFRWQEGQLPIYYNHYNTSRPAKMITIVLRSADRFITVSKVSFLIWKVTANLITVILHSVTKSQSPKCNCCCNGYCCQ